VGAYILRRLLIAVPTLVGISIISFAIISLAPGDAVSAMISGQEGVASVDVQQRLRSRFGLDDPLPVRYARWIAQVAQGNLGTSLADSQPVSRTIWGNVWLTLQISMPALLVAIIIAVAFGASTGFRPYSRFDHAVTAVSMILIATPAFVLALLALYFFAVRMPLFPSGGNQDILSLEPPTVWGHVRYYVLPIATLALLNAASLIRYVRDSVIDVRNEDYVRTARAKGATDGSVLMGHVLRNALLPVITVTALHLPSLITGALLVETVFGWGGIGTRIFLAISQRDFPVIMAATMLVGVAILVANLAADILYAVVDPRIHVG
jgi:peptide/nickel transport system permease protein